MKKTKRRSPKSGILLVDDHPLARIGVRQMIETDPELEVCCEAGTAAEGLSAAIAAVGQVAGPLVAGVLADLTGDYRLGFTLLAILSSLGSLAFMLATRPEQKEAGQAPVS